MLKYFTVLTLILVHWNRNFYAFIHDLVSDVLTKSNICNWRYFQQLMIQSLLFQAWAEHHISSMSMLWWTPDPRHLQKQTWWIGKSQKKLNKLSVITKLKFIMRKSRINWRKKECYLWKKQNKKHSNTQSKVETNVHDSDKKSYASIDSHQWFFMQKKHAQFNRDWKRFLY